MTDNSLRIKNYNLINQSMTDYKKQYIPRVSPKEALSKNMNVEKFWKERYPVGQKFDKKV